MYKHDVNIIWCYKYIYTYTHIYVCIHSKSNIVQLPLAQTGRATWTNTKPLNAPDEPCNREHTVSIQGTVQGRAALLRILTCLPKYAWDEAHFQMAIWVALGSIAISPRGEGRLCNREPSAPMAVNYMACVSSSLADVYLQTPSMLREAHDHTGFLGKRVTLQGAISSTIADLARQK